MVLEMVSRYWSVGWTHKNKRLYRSLEKLKFHAFPLILTPPVDRLGSIRTPSPDLWLVPGHYQDTSREGGGWKSLMLDLNNFFVFVSTYWSLANDYHSLEERIPSDIKRL